MNSFVDGTCNMTCIATVDGAMARSVLFFDTNCDGDAEKRVVSEYPIQSEGTPAPNTPEIERLQQSLQPRQAQERPEPKVPLYTETIPMNKKPAD
ncbi:MAG: hypothetical protein HQM16_06400 [Deltaproteobacteria bacterium]|nr:hypothetical protein [Deltaproteobacteria bacterium]